ncbi:MAG: pyridoxal phosphate-dependent aminotransferase, partial [Oscillospiraceae bacterium]|nr:pyridoxal phosphate-dependent aminotransferase [Oscillospiraceae bacterium]
MISETMKRLGTGGCVIREIAAYSQQRKAEIGRENVFDFSIGNPSIPTPAVVQQTMQKLLEE